jgi:small conductance mechanosensitive channel
MQDKLWLWTQQAVSLLPEMLAAIVVFIAFCYTANVSQYLLRKILRKTFRNIGLTNFIEVIFKIAIIGLGFILAMSILHLDKAVVSILAGIGIIGIGLGFAFQDLAANLVSGIGLVMREDYPFKVGDFIETAGIQGTVRDIDLRSTTLETVQGHTIIIPNKLVYEKHIHNLTLLGKRRVDLDLAVSYTDDLEKVEHVAKSAIASLSELVYGEKIELFFTDFADSAIELKLVFWVVLKEGNEHLYARHKAIKLIKEAFASSGITIPYPVRTLNFVNN